MRILSAYVRAITALNEWLARYAAYLVMPIFVLLLAEVFLRYVAGSPTVWTNELSQMLFGVYAVLSGGYLLAHNAHAHVDIVHSRLPPRGRALLDVITSALLFVFAGALLYFGSSIAWESVTRLEHSQSAWNPPLYPVKMFIPIGAALLLLQGLARLAQNLCVLLDIGRIGTESRPRTSGFGERGEPL